MIGDNVRKYREQLGLTQEALAEQSRLSFRGLQDIEYNRTKSPRRHTLEQIAKALGVSVDALYVASSGQPNAKERTVGNMLVSEFEKYLESYKENRDPDLKELMAVATKLTRTMRRDLIQVAKTLLGTEAVAKATAKKSKT